MKKVRNRSSENKSSSTSGHTAPSKPSSRPKLAADILKLNWQPTSESRQPTISLEMEVDQYLSDPNQGTGILEFWQVVLIFLNYTSQFLYWHVSQEHEHRYPRIFHLAMDIIPIQASSVPCERVFSSGKATMAPWRSRISGELMESLQILTPRRSSWWVASWPVLTSELTCDQWVIVY